MRPLPWLALLALLSACVRAEPSFDAQLNGYPYPYPPQTFALHTQDQDLQMTYVDVHPAAGNGQTVLLLHGKNFTSAYWEPTIKALAESGYRVLAVDQIGFGKSSKPTHFQFSFQELAEDTRQLLDSLHIDKVNLVGHSMGGMLATRFALMFPGRVRRLALIDPIGLEDWKRLVPYHTVDQNYGGELKATRASVKTYMQENYFAGEWKPEYDVLLEPQVGWQNGPDRAVVAWDAALTSDMCFTQPVLYEFKDLRPATLLMVGSLDRTALGKAWAPPEVKARMGYYPALGQEAARAIPDCKLVLIEGAGHLPQVTHFDRYLKTLKDFLE